MFYKKFALIGLFGLLLVAAGPFSALASVHISTNEENYAPAVDDWSKYGSVKIFDDGRVALTQEKTQTEHLYTDVDIPSGADFAVLVSYMRAEKPHANFSNGSENISGLPYLYAYLLDDDGDINEYLAESTMRQKASAGKTWQVAYSIIDLSSDDDSVRFFLKQTSREGTTSDGRAAWFYKPGLYFVDTWSEGREIVEAYEDELSDVREEIGLEYYSASDNDNDFDLPTGALVKCPGEPEVYSVTSSDTLKLFPNQDTFYAWGKSFSDVRSISCDRLDDYEVSGTWTYTRADYLVKFHSYAGVYTLDNGEYLRLIPDEYTAKKMYGSNWISLIREHSASKKDDFIFSAPHESLKRTR